MQLNSSMESVIVHLVVAYHYCRGSFTDSWQQQQHNFRHHKYYSLHYSHQWCTIPIPEWFHFWLESELDSESDICRSPGIGFRIGIRHLQKSWNLNLNQAFRVSLELELQSESGFQSKPGIGIGIGIRSVPESCIIDSHLTLSNTFRLFWRGSAISQAFWKWN